MEGAFDVAVTLLLVLVTGSCLGNIHIDASNLHGRVQQLEIELRRELQGHLKEKLQVAFSASHFHPLSDVASEQGTVLRTSLITAPREGWELVEDSERETPLVKISDEAPVCVVTPLPKKTNLEEAQAADDEIGAHHVVSSRLIHAGRMIRMARDFVVAKLKLEDRHHKRRPRDPDLRPALLHVVAPDELADIVCTVVWDEFLEFTLRSTCSKFSDAISGNADAPKKQCSFAIWGSSASQTLRGSSVAGSIFSFQAGIELNLDEGDTIPPAVFNPSWIPDQYPNFTDPAVGVVKDIPTDPLAGPYTVVTAFSKNHYTVGLRLMNSILIHGPQSSIPFTLVVYTMETFEDIKAQQVLCVAEQIKKAGIPVVVRAFDFQKFPNWMYVRHYKAGWWAWKSVMVWETYVQRRGLVLWLDAGDFLSSDVALPETFIALGDRSFVGITREWFGMNFRWTHPGTITFLGVDVSSTTTQCCGCLWGVAPKTYATMLRVMYECSMTLQCIAPEGSSMGNHRQDQSVLSVLAWHNGLKCEGPHEELLWKCDGGRNHCSEEAQGGAAEICQLK